MDDGARLEFHSRGKSGRSGEGCRRGSQQLRTGRPTDFRSCGGPEVNRRGLCEAFASSVGATLTVTRRTYNKCPPS